MSTKLLFSIGWKTKNKADPWEEPIVHLIVVDMSSFILEYRLIRKHSFHTVSYVISTKAAVVFFFLWNPFSIITVRVTDHSSPFPRLNQLGMLYCTNWRSWCYITLSRILRGSHNGSEDIFPDILQIFPDQSIFLEQ